MRWNPQEGVFIDYYNLHTDAGYVKPLISSKLWLTFF